MVELGHVAYEHARQAILADRDEVGSLDKALADLREKRGDPFLVWQYVRTFEGGEHVLRKVAPTLDIDALSREQMLELVGLICGYTITVTKDSEKVDEARPTTAAGGNT
jgi:hypothetical protein